MLRRYRRRGNILPFLVEAAEQFVDDPVRCELAVTRLVREFAQHRLEEARAFTFGDQNTGVVRRQADFGDEAFTLFVRQLRQLRFQSLYVVGGELQRQQIGVREVAIVVRLFLRTHRAGLALVRIVQPGFLIDGAAILQNSDLAAGFIMDRLPYKADRVHVLDLAAGAEALAGPPHRDVDVRAQVALLHVAVAGAEIAQDRAKLGDVALRFLGGADIRLRDDLHQGNARTVEIDKGHGGMLIVQQLAGVLLQMQSLDTDRHALAAGKIDDHGALANDRRFVLADLVALRQVRIEVVLPVEGRFQVDLRLEAQPGAHRLRHALLVDNGQHAGHRRVHQRDVIVRRAAEFG